jgi:hypothetical protein
MTQDMENEARPVPSKEEIIEKVIDIFIDTIGFIERYEVSKDTNVLEDFKIYHDDISLFLVRVFRHFGMPTILRPDCAPTIEGISNLVFDYLSTGQKYEDPRDKQGLWGKFLKWISL